MLRCHFPVSGCLQALVQVSLCEREMQRLELAILGVLKALPWLGR